MNERFQIVGEVGRGAFGVVHRAIDRRTGAEVALKVPTLSDVDELRWLKREFRILRGVRHPNLVRLFELFATEHTWYTMELLQGVHLDDPSWERTPASVATVVHQLADGLAGLHAAGICHGDLKPANVLVLADGGVRLLDFGLARKMRSRTRAPVFVGGSLAFMPPEMFEGRFEAASDAYALAATLHWSLVGRLPYEPTDAARRPSPDMGALTAFLPEQGVALVRDMLAPRPEDRPGVEELREALRPLARAARGVREVRAPSAAGFVGRERELARAVAHVGTHPARHRVVWVHGPSGFGKTAFAHAVLETLDAWEPAVTVLTGRCHPSERVPYAPIDEVLDQLSQSTSLAVAADDGGLDAAERHALVRAFPSVAGQLEVPAGPDALGEADQRGRALAAVADLLEGACRGRPLVVWIDDLQWADQDTLAMLGRALVHAPSVRWILCSREEQSVVLEDARGAAPLEVLPVGIGPLTSREVRQLADDLLDDPDTEEVEALAAASDGVPFVVLQLCRSGGAVGGGPGLGDLVGELDAAARLVLQRLVVAGRPVDEERLQRVCGPAAFRGAVEDLALVRLVDRRRVAETWLLEPSHDRVRQELLTGMPSDERSAHHLAWVEELLSEQEVDDGAVAHHLTMAGDPRAAAWTVRAGARAAEQLAFDSAAALFRQALDLDPGSLDSGGIALDRTDVLVRLARALDHAGRWPEAAAVWLEASERPDCADPSLMRRRACHLLLGAGHGERGLDLLPRVLADVGLSLPSTLVGALTRVAVNRGRVGLGGLRITWRHADEVDPKLLAQIDVCWLVSASLSMVDTLRGAGFQALGVVLALRAGEPYRIARVLGIDGAYRAMTGSDGASATDRVLELAQEAAERSGEAHAEGIAVGSVGVVDFMTGRFDDALRRCDEASAIYRSRCRGVRWEQDTAAIFALMSLFRLGRWQELLERAEHLAADADRVGDAYLYTQVTERFLALRALCRDAPGEAAAAVDEAMGRWSAKGFQLQHYWAMVSRAWILLYEGRVEEADAAWRAQAMPLQTSLLLSIHLMRAEWRATDARLALARLASAPARQRRGLERRVARQVRGLRRERTAWTRAHGDALAACLAAWRGARAEASRGLQRAHDVYVEAGMLADATWTALRLAQLQGERAPVIPGALGAIARVDRLVDVFLPWPASGGAPSEDG